MADLHEIGLKMREWRFKELSLLHYHPPSPSKVHIVLLAMNGPLAAELKFRENTALVGRIAWWAKRTSAGEANSIRPTSMSAAW